MKILSERPYVVCHILSSIDGRISGSLFDMNETMTAQAVYSQIRQDYNCQAVLNGTVTCAGIYADGYVEELSDTDEQYPRLDHQADTALNKYVVCVDAKGTLKWHKNEVERSGEKSHVIEVLTEAVSDAYLAYLRSLNISYLFAGKERLDIALALEKLKKLFHIDSLMVTGGGVVDWTFIEAGMLDELSLVIAPVVTGQRNKATVFDQSSFSLCAAPFALKLNEAKTYPHSVLYLNYANHENE